MCVSEATPRLNVLYSISPATQVLFAKLPTDHPAFFDPHHPMVSRAPSILLRHTAGTPLVSPPRDSSAIDTPVASPTAGQRSPLVRQRSGSLGAPPVPAPLTTNASTASTGTHNPDKDKLKLLKREYVALRDAAAAKQKAFEDLVQSLRAENNTLKAKLDLLAQAHAGTSADAPHP